MGSTIEVEPANNAVSRKEHQRARVPMAPVREREIQPINTRRVYNRVAAVMSHAPWYGCRSQARLATDAGVSEAALSRFLAGHSNPSYALVEAICRSLEKRLGRTIPPRELVSMDGSYPTASACELAGCRGCSPRQVYESDAFSYVKPGQFRYPTSNPPKTPEPEVDIAAGQGKEDL